MRKNKNELLDIKRQLIDEFGNTSAIAGMSYTNIDGTDCLRVYFIRARGNEQDIPIDAIQKKLLDLVDENAMAIRDTEFFNFLNERG